jgi:hypothetical protein
MSDSIRIDLHHAIMLPVAPGACLDLFTPLGECAWIPDWRPRFIHPADGATGEALTFTTDPGGRLTWWMMAVHDPDAGLVRYVRLTPGLRSVLLTVRCRPEGAGSRVDVDYRVVALSEEGETENRAFAAGFVAMIEGWRRLVLDHLGPATAD